MDGQWKENPPKAVAWICYGHVKVSIIHKVGGGSFKQVHIGRTIESGFACLHKGAGE
ncbi:hypothetical protein Csa_007585 [Cucumis sativus]|uniref:Uncharacterized protein n=1 Tax=Cucumis sativus TaxID=3659 RepID=A0A0A0LZ34_CUCSA|nr:hypothetical protein Csa_007585 [Cucumis sativus]